MTKEEIISELGRPVLRVIGLTQAIFILAFISSPFIWIWGGWQLAWKIGLTALIGIIFLFLIYKGVEKTVTDAVNEKIKKLVPKIRNDESDNVVGDNFSNVVRETGIRRRER